jgi:hypothetical protein
MHPQSTRRVLLCTLLLIALNLLLAARLFGVEYSAYRASIEGTFIALARIMAKFPGEWKWWPFWCAGMPYEDAYVPFSHMLVAAFSLLTGFSAARAFHIVSAAVYVLSAPAVFWMALTLSRRLAASFFASLAYSLVSFCALLVPAIRADAGGALALRRLHVLVYWGEAPHTLALALVTVAVVCFARAVTDGGVKWKILAGIVSAAIALSNPFGIVALGVALLCWLAAFEPRPLWKPVLTFSAIAALSYCWAAPWLSPSLIRAIRANSSNVGGDYRYTAVTWVVLATLACGYVVLWLAMRRLSALPHVRFFVLYAWVFAAIVGAWYAWGVALLPQPSRYQLEADLALPLAVVFAAAALCARFPLRVRYALGGAVALAFALQTVHSVGYSRNLIRAADRDRMVEYKISTWMDEHRPGQQAFISGSTSFLYNVFTDNPQLHGGHEQFGLNRLIPIVAYTIYFGTNAGDRDADYSIFWLKAFGAHAISVSGPNGAEYYKAFAHPRKFDGVLPLLWRDGDDSIYEVPSRSPSLAHVIPAAAVVTRAPRHGLDIEPSARYVDALDDPQYPPAEFRWKSMSEAQIRATLAPGQLLHVQVTYAPGWEAWSARGTRLRTRRDGLGLMVIEPDSPGDLAVSLRYTGGREALFMRLLSALAMLAAFVYAWFGRR